LSNITFRFLSYREGSPLSVEPKVCNYVYGVIYVLYVIRKGESKGFPV